MNDAGIDTRREGPVEYVTLNRPEVRNAFNAATIRALTSWAGRAAVDRDIRAVVLAGAGPSFSAGADIAWMSETARYSEDRNRDDALAAARMFEAIDTLPVPVVGRIQGAALGGGAGLAAVCDVVVAADDALFGFTEVRLGIIPAVISPFVVAKIGLSAARQLFVTGARFGAIHAKDIGLVHSVVPATELDATVASCVADCLAGGPDAIAAIKALVAQVAGMPPDAARALTADALAARRVSPEGQAGLTAFLAKRTPPWRA